MASPETHPSPKRFGPQLVTTPAPKKKLRPPHRARLLAAAAPGMQLAFLALNVWIGVAVLSVGALG